MTNKGTIMLRQGDVLICRVDDIPSTAKPEQRKGDVILAHGEVTGHAHRIPSRSAKMFATEEGTRFMRVGGTAPVALNHEEHTTVKIPPGCYRVSLHAEYQPGELPRQVAD